MTENNGRLLRTLAHISTDNAVKRVEAVLAENPDATAADVLAALRADEADARAAYDAELDDNARPVWTYHPENLPAAREAGYDV